MIHVLSLGAGVQSTTMALMAAHGEITPMPDCAIFADTGWEPKEVYAQLERLEKTLPFPVHRVSHGNIREASLAGGSKYSGRFASVPWFVRNPDGSDGIGRRQCTKEYKLHPIRRKIRELLGHKTPKAGASMWIGISTDEVLRLKPSQVQYIVNRWPLIEAKLNRNDCLRWLERHGYPLPQKSSCIGCPYHNNAQWRAIKNDPEAWAEAVEVDAAIRQQPKFRGQQFMHRSLVPLGEADLRSDDDKGGQLDLFNNECEGMCGV